MKSKAISVAALLAVTPAIAASATAGMTSATDTPTAEQNDDDDFPVGLFGLLGLVGLLGLKHRDTHIDRDNTTNR